MAQNKNEKKGLPPGQLSDSDPAGRLDNTQDLVSRVQDSSQTTAWFGLASKIEGFLHGRYRHRRIFPLGYELDDFVMEVMVRVFQEIKTFVHRGPGSFWSWLQPVADRILIDLMRRERSQKRGGGRPSARLDDTEGDSLDDVADPKGVSATSYIAFQELAHAERDCVSRLSDSARDVYLARRVEGLEFSKISELRGGAPEGTLRKTYMRAREVVHECLRRRLDLLGPSVEGWK